MVKARLARLAVAGGLLVGAVGLALAPVPASARVFFRVGIGVPLFAPVLPAPVYYPPPPPPVYYAPAPSPVYYAPPAAAAPAVTAAPARSDCRQYSTTTVIDGQPRQAFGTACLQPDGSWRIVD